MTRYLCVILPPESILPRRDNLAFPFSPLLPLLRLFFFPDSSRGEFFATLLGVQKKKQLHFLPASVLFDSLNPTCMGKKKRRTNFGHRLPRSSGPPLSRYISRWTRLPHFGSSPKCHRNKLNLNDQQQRETCSSSSGTLRKFSSSTHS